MVTALANENPVGEVSIMNIVGDLKLKEDGEYLNITYIGREDIARRIEYYIERVNYDGSHEAMIATLEFRVGRKK